MRIKVYHVIYAVVFVLMLLTPMVFVNPYGGVVAENENRMLASRPPMSYAFNHPRDFIRQLDGWFSDNVGFRDTFINIYKVIAKLENNVQYKEGNLIMLTGEDGHHYYADVNGWMINKFQGKTFLSDEQLQGLVNGLSSAKQYLDEKGIPLIVMFCTDKEEIYPEYYPKVIKRGSGPTQLDIITTYVKDHTDIDVFNIKECLLQAKSNYPVFDKNGDAAGILSHYNEIGAFFAYQELMKHINTYFPEIRAFTINDVDITYADKGTYHDIPDVRLKQEITYKRLDNEYGIVFENNDSSLPTILFMRDSYTGDANYLSRYIPEHFGKTILIHWANMENLDSYIKYFKPDIVVFESAERALGGFANIVASLQNLE